ncbi:serine hydroxymethyltransferase [candidate division bacterium WOR-3 4484_18]|uniref:Serine hydroxymethyltransferase n=1 Tax=candidate division WOR-3 bacterium 4484_18 TaxID=2020626 RepID=A0A257LUY0_UNCW3|nr:MAG: serine hydroxymethyltransferase [candidate division bacterium WOR-3 4484_18]
MLELLKKTDPEIYNAIKGELERQRNNLELIASENFPSLAVLVTMASVMNNKYAEGYPGKRYYGGCEWMDVVETLAIERVKKLFGAEHVNVQPLSGVPANLAAYMAVAKPGDTIMGLTLSHGGHLSHGHKVSFSGILFNAVQYTVNRDTELIDYEQLRKLAHEVRPKIIVSGASAYPRIIDFKKFREIADEVGAYHIADIAHIAGLVVAGLHPSPIPYADIVTTTTHKTLRGPRSAIIMCKQELARAVDKWVFPGLHGGPHMHVIAAKAVCFKEAMQAEFKEYQRQIVKNAKAMEETFKELGYRLVSGGTDTHLLLVDLRSKGITGKEAEEALDKAGITVNKNTIPYDPQKPFIASGIRIGTPAITTRGMKEAEARRIVELIDKVLSNVGKEQIYKEVRQEVNKLLKEFPLYPELRL